jgi:hypothetical protein
MSFWRRYRPARAVKPVSRIRPRLEVLEDRCVPSTFTVTKVSDTGLNGDGSLRGEILAAGNGDTVNFAPGLHGATITLGGTAFLNKNITIDGAGSGITVDGNGLRVFQLDPGAFVHINGLTITGGVAPFPGFVGGGIYNGGFLSLENSTVTGNTGGGAGIYNALGGTMFMSGDTVNNNSAGAGSGGGISNVGALEIVNCTIAHNTANLGGGIANIGHLDVVNSTVADNTVTGAGADGGGIYSFGAGSHLSLLNTIVFNPNSGAATKNHDDVVGVIDQAQGNLFGNTVSIAPVGDLGSNRFNKDPLLGPLQDNGGRTATMALLPGSPAIGGGVSTSLIPGLTVPTTDQRGDPRPANSIDLGAFQTQPPSQPPGSVQDVTALLSIQRGKLRHKGGRYRQTITVHNAGAPLQGPLYLVVDQLTRKVRLRHATARTAQKAPLGSPYVLLSLANNMLGTGATQTVVLTFGNPLGRKIQYSLRVLDGAGQP